MIFVLYSYCDQVTEQSHNKNIKKYNNNLIFYALFSFYLLRVMWIILTVQKWTEFTHLLREFKVAH